MDIQGIVTLIITLATIITSVTTIYKCLISFLRKMFEKQFDNFEKRLDALESQTNQINSSLIISNDLLDKLKQANMEQCRNSIKDIYYRNRENKSLTDWERKSLIVTFDLYHNVLGGNTYITELYSEMMSWEHII